MSTKALTKEDVLSLADMANLVLSEHEVESLLLQLAQTIEYIENLSELDTSKVKPTYHTTNSVNETFKDGEDNPRTLSVEDVFRNSPNDAVDGKFRVSKIIDKDSK